MSIEAAAITKALMVASPTPSAPPRVENPIKHPIEDIEIPKNKALIVPA